MKENYNPIFEDEKSISIAGLCEYLLKKWKVMILAALILAIAFGGVSYMKSGKNAAQGTSTIAISEYDKQVVLAKMDLIQSNEKLAAEYEYYIANSIKARLNPNSVYEGVAAFQVSAEDISNAMSVYELCEKTLFDDVFYKELAESLSEETDVSMVKEVIWFDKDFSLIMNLGEDTSSDIDYEFTVYVRHFDEADCQTMMSSVESQMKKLPQLLEKNGVNASVSQVYANVGAVVDRSLAPLKKDLQTAKMAAYETITNTKTNMSDAQKDYYEYLLKQDNQEVSETAPAEVKREVDPIMVAAGAAAGIVLIAVLYAAFYILGGRIQNTEELESWLKVPVIESKAGMGLVAANLEAIAVKNETKELYLTGSLEKENTEDLAQLKKLLAEKGIQVRTGSSILKDAKALEDAANCGSVVFMEKCSVSKEKTVRDMAAKAVSCGICILGVILEK